MNKLKQWLHHISAQHILMMVSFFILLHVTLLIIYSYQHNDLEHQNQRQAAVQKIMDVVHEMKNSRAPEKAINTLQSQTMRITLTSQPMYTNHIYELSYSAVNHAVPSKGQTITLSLRLTPTQWMNIQARTTETIWDDLLFVVLELAIAITLLFYAWSINRFTRPLQDFRLAAERLGVDIHATPLEQAYRGPSIIQETAEAMNSMQTRIQELLHARTELLAAISHDLRTPITRLKLRANLISDPELAQKSLRDLDDMEAMIAEILAFAKGDYCSEEKKQLELNSLLQSICDDMKDMGLQAEYAPAHPGKLPFYGRPLVLKRALTNLIHNAVKYGHIARVSSHQHLGKIIILIEDEGPGIPENELDKVFLAFHRCDNSRSRQIGGTGLGLTVARDAIIAHNGTIKLANRPQGGLQVKVILNASEETK